MALKDVGNAIVLLGLGLDRPDFPRDSKGFEPLEYYFPEKNDTDTDSDYDSEEEKQELMKQELERIRKERAEKAAAQIEARKKRAELKAQRLEAQKQAELEAQRQRQAELEAQRQRQAELEAQRQRQVELEAQRQRQAELEAQRQRQAELEAQRQRQAELEAQRQRQVELEAQRQRQVVLEAQRQRQAELEAQRQRQVELEAQRQRRAELEAQKLEAQKRSDLEAQKQADLDAELRAQKRSAELDAKERSLVRRKMAELETNSESEVDSDAEIEKLVRQEKERIRREREARGNTKARKQTGTQKGNRHASLRLSRPSPPPAGSDVSVFAPPSPSPSPPPDLTEDESGLAPPRQAEELTASTQQVEIKRKKGRPKRIVATRKQTGTQKGNRHASRRLSRPSPPPAGSDVSVFAPPSPSPSPPPALTEDESGLASSHQAGEITASLKEVEVRIKRGRPKKLIAKTQEPVPSTVRRKRSRPKRIVDETDTTVPTQDPASPGAPPAPSTPPPPDTEDESLPLSKRSAQIDGESLYSPQPAVSEAAVTRQSALKVPRLAPSRLEFDLSATDKSGVGVSKKSTTPKARTSASRHVRTTTVTSTVSRRSSRRTSTMSTSSTWFVPEEVSVATKRLAVKAKREGGLSPRRLRARSPASESGVSGVSGSEAEGGEGRHFVVTPSGKRYKRYEVAGRSNPTPDVRRTRRVRIPPVNPLKGEKAEYNTRRKSGMNLVGVLVPEDKEAQRTERRGRKKAIPLEDEDFPFLNLVHPKTQQESSHQLMYTSASCVAVDGLGEMASEDSDLSIFKHYSSGEGGTTVGIMKFKAHAEKMRAATYSFEMFFYVIKGKLLFKINDEEIEVSATQGTMKVPKGVFYSIRNLRGSEAEVFFVVMPGN